MKKARKKRIFLYVSAEKDGPKNYWASTKEYSSLSKALQGSKKQAPVFIPAGIGRPIQMTKYLIADYGQARGDNRPIVRKTIRIHENRKKRIVRRKRRISEREIMRIKRKLKKSAKKLRLGAKRTGAYVYGTLRRIVGNPGGLKILGYRSGMQYLTDGKDVYRRDKMDMKHGGMKWYSTYASFPASIRAYGPLTSPRGLRGNPSVTMQDIQRIVGKINSEGGGVRVVPAGSGGLNLYVDRISPYDEKIIDVGHEYLLRGTKRDVYEALIKIRFIPMYNPYARKTTR